MKSLSEIKRAAKKGDYTVVAELVEKSPSLVREVVKGNREDHHGIQKTFSDMLESRERMKERIARGRAKKEQTL